MQPACGASTIVLDVYIEFTPLDKSAKPLLISSPFIHHMEIVIHPSNQKTKLTAERSKVQGRLLVNVLT